MIILIDNYDSFTYNLYDYVKQLNKEVTVFRNDEITLKKLKSLDFESIILSPGPGRPKDAGITNSIIAYYWDKKPILGICLGHQAIGEFFGTKLEKAIKPMHGKTSLLKTTKHPIWENIPNEFSVMRYHSLVLKKLPTELLEIAATSESENMAFVHESYPIVGIQFHPESILTEHGLQIMRNWTEFINKELVKKYF